MVVIERGPSSWLDGASAFGNAIRPGTGIVFADPVVDHFLASTVGADGLAGLDRDHAQYLVLVDDGAVRGAALVGTIADDAALTEQVPNTAILRDHGHAVIGARPVVDAIRAWALGTLAGQPGLGRPSATVYVGNLLTRHGPELVAARNKLVTTSMTGGDGTTRATTAMGVKALNALLAIGGDTEQVVVTFDADAGVASLDLAFVPRAGSALAKFVAAQRPSDFGLLRKLPAGPAPMIAAGGLRAGPYQGVLEAVVSSMYAGADSKELVGPTIAVMHAASGEFAMVGHSAGAGLQSVQVMTLEQPAVAERAYAQMFAAMAQPISSTVLGFTVTQQSRTDGTSHDGVPIRGFDTVFDVSKLTVAQRAAILKSAPTGRTSTYVALVDDLAATANGFGDGQQILAQTIDTARGHVAGFTLSATAAPLIADARARHDSCVMLFDLSMVPNLVPAGTTAPTGQFEMSANFADQRAHMRWTMPVEVVKSMAAMGKPAPSAAANLARATELKDKMCACKDAACVGRVNVEAEAWGKGIEGQYKDAKDVPPDLMNTMLEMAKCEARTQVPMKP
jgi:hypothetical protein